MKFKAIVTIAIFFSSVFYSNAAIIKIDRADAVFSSSNVDLATEWSNLDTSTIISQTLPTQSLLFNGSQFNNTIFKLTMEFTSSKDRVLDLFSGLDAGRGAELYVNNVLVSDANTNLWWSRSWTHSQVFSNTGLDIDAGQNIIELYWAENVNSGGNSFQFSVDGSKNQQLSGEALANAVPVPSIISLIFAGLIGLLVTRKK